MRRGKPLRTLPLGLYLITLAWDMYSIFSPNIMKYIHVQKRISLSQQFLVFLYKEKKMLEIVLSEVTFKKSQLENLLNMIKIILLKVVCGMALVNHGVRFPSHA